MPAAYPLALLNAVTAWCRWLLHNVMQGSITEVCFSIGNCSTSLMCSTHRCSQCDDICTILPLLLRLLLGSTVKLSFNMTS